jgi:hypothetical protein
LTLPAGATTQADNCVMPARDVIRPRRGQGPYGSIYIDNDNTDANSNRAKEMYQWGAHLLINYTGNAGYKLSSFANLSTYANVGSYAPPDPTVMRMKFAELAKSVYWTTDAGLYTLDVVGGTARAAGRHRPLIVMVDADGGLFTRLSGNPNATGAWFAKNQTVAYRATLGKVDGNGRVVESAASGRCIVVNPNDVTVAIGSLVRNGNVVTATVSAHKFRVGDLVDLTLSGGDVGNFDTTNNSITEVTSTSIKWAETAANYTNVAQVTITSGTKAVQVGIFLPSQATAGDFARLYRTDEVSGEATDPGDECFLAYERVLTSADISNGYVTISDTTPSSFLDDPLDSNANTGEGALGVNTAPPLCRDLVQWDGKLWGGHTTDVHRLRLRLLGVGSGALSGGGLQSGDLLAIGTRVFTAGTDFELYSQYLPTENVDRTTKYISYLIYGNMRTIGYTASHEYDGATGLGMVMVEQTTPASTLADGSSGTVGAIYAATSRATAWGDALAATRTITAASTSRTGSTVTVRCVAHGFVTGQTVMVAYNVASSSIDANFPVGLKTSITRVDADNFSYTESGSATTLTSTYYAYAITYKSDDNRQPVRFSRPGLPDAWPLANAIGGLPDGAEVLRIKPTPDGGELIVCLKNGDIYAIGGQYPYNVRRVDGSAQLFAADTLVEHANQLRGLTTQGPAVIGASGVGVFGPDIEDEWRDYVTTGAGADRSGFWAMSYESDRQYHLHFPNASNLNAVAYVFHSLLGQWTRWTPHARSCGLVFRGSDVLLVGVTDSNRLWTETKAFGTSLYTTVADNIHGITANGAQTSVTTIAVNNRPTDAAAGDLIRISGTEYRVTAVGSGTLTIGTAVTVSNGQAITYRGKVTSSVTFAVEAGGMPGVEKKFRELQLHFGRRHFETMTVTFKSEHNDTATGTVSVTPNDYSLGTQTNRPSTCRVEVPTSMKSAAMLTVTLSVAEAYGFFDLLGYSVTFEAMSERTGK